MIKKENITGIILAGGKSSRMGSDKGLIAFNHSTFIEHIITAMKPLVNEITIVSDNEDYNKFGYKRITDLIKNSGPIAGLYSGLNHSETKNILVLSCDVPLIKTFVLQQLVEAFDDRFDVIQLQSENKTMPLIAIYKKNCQDTFKHLLDKGEKRLRIAVGLLNNKTITIDPKYDQYVKNINTKAQLNEIQHAVEH